MQTLVYRIPNRYGLNIAVIVELPENPEGLIFIVHGFLSVSNRSSPAAMAETALANGFVALRFDTTHSLGESDGSTELATITSFIQDLEDVVAWAQTQSWFKTPYLLSGSSLGGITALEHAHRYKDDIKAVAVLAPVISGAFSLEAGQRRRYSKLEEWRRTGVETRQVDGPTPVTLHVPWSHMEDRMRYDVLEYALEMTMPLFLYVGSIDESCPPDQQQVLFEAWGGKKELLS